MCAHFTPQAGAGADWIVVAHWSLKAEYLYVETVVGVEKVVARRLCAP